MFPHWIAHLEGDERRGPSSARRGASRRDRTVANAAPVDGSDKPAEATGGDAKLAVKRVRQVAAPAAAADGAQGE